MPHPFEVRASSPSVDEVDEILIFWGSTPAGSTASFYLPAVHAADVIALADAMYPAHRLSVIDANTIGCPVGAATLIPIPKGVGAYAGLLAVDLPPGISRGDSYDIVVRQITKATAVPLQPQRDRDCDAGGRRRPPAVLLAQDERHVPGDHHHQHERGAALPRRAAAGLAQVEGERGAEDAALLPGAQRYLGLVIGRVGGFGGNPGQIPPSPSGNVPGHFPPSRTARRTIVSRRSSSSPARSCR